MTTFALIWGIVKGPEKKVPETPGYGRRGGSLDGKGREADNAGNDPSIHRKLFHKQNLHGTKILRTRALRNR